MTRLGTLLIAALLIGLCLPAPGRAQSREVRPGELSLSLRIENTTAGILPHEMVLVSIEGRYRRHITLEKLRMPELANFDWMQLGTDMWFETRENGRPVKNFRRRMALFPRKPGALVIPPFVHELHLTDEGDDWFAHELVSEPVTLRVDPLPADAGWFFPVRRLEVSDSWSNPPDQLAEGGGVLRIVRIEAVGVGPAMIPPMPELNAPSALVFAHPEKRLVELSPQGPVTIAFWRWTVRPTNGASAMLDPFEITYFDTTARVTRTLTVAAQRIALAEPRALPPPPEPVRRHRALLIGLVAGPALVGGIYAAGRPGRGRRPRADPALWRDRHLPGWGGPGRALMRAARRGDLVAMTRAAGLLAERVPGPGRAAALCALASALYGRGTPPPADPVRLARGFLRSP